QLSFPSTQSSHGSTGFTFSLSGNQDIGGPQAGFECIQQTSARGPFFLCRSLESLGALSCKMRIQANDDVYETTRHRMVVAEENNKNKWVIKPNRPDIGRKVKVRTTVGRTIPPSSSSSRHRDSTSIPTSTSQSSVSSSYKSANTSRSRIRTEKKIPDIMRRPLKERFIHLLALRPYKKPELYDRLIREGVRERERNIMTMTLKQVAYIRDNTYHLQRHIWNDVQEDWPYYTEQEKALLKRRKPQNLTPPGSSDGGSSGSGQSPNSTHPGSPPAITAPPPLLLNDKRPGYYQGNDGLPTKKPRISHYKKSETNSGSSNLGDNGRTAGSGGGSGGGGINSGGSGGGSAISGGAGCSSANIISSSSGGVIDSWDQRQHAQRDRRGDCRPERTANSDVLRSYGKPCLTPTSDSEEPTSQLVVGHRDGITGMSSSNASHSSHGVTHSISSSGNRHHYIGKAPMPSADGAASSAAVDCVAARPMPSVMSDGSGASNYNSSNRILADRRDRGERYDRSRVGDRDHDSRRNETSGNQYNNMTAPGYTATDENTVSTSSCGLDLPDSPKSSEYPDYLTYYTTISSAEQRRRYKAEFNADYEEYRRLHAQVAKVSKRFTQLQDRLKREQACGNWNEYEAIRQLILYEYNETKRDPKHRETKHRFHYLHEKLSHIKRLVLEYDTQNIGGMTTNNADSSNEINDVNKSTMRM
ncbi:hypothetical protein E2986_03464, partial [Frieseomelitta varia]